MHCLSRFHAPGVRCFSSTSRAAVSPMRDGVFKALFHDEADPGKLISFLNAVKGYGGSDKIHSIVFRDPYFPAFAAGEKNIIADVVCESFDALKKRPEIHIVEMQWARQGANFRRWEFYAGRAFTTELSSGGSYGALKNVHVTAITPDPSPYPNDTYVLTGKVSKTVIKESREVTLLSLSGITPVLSAADSPLTQWLHLIKYGGTAQLQREVLERDPVLSRAVNHLERLRQHPPPQICESECEGTSWSLLNRKIRELPR